MAAPDEANIVVGNADFSIGSSLGYIKEGITIQKNEDMLFIEGAEGVFTSPKAFRTKANYTISCTVIEPTLANLQYMLDANDAIGGTPPLDTLDVGKKAEGGLGLIERVLTLQSYEPGVTTDLRLITIDRAVSNGPGEIKFTQFEEVKLPMVFETVYNDDATRQILITDA